MLNWRDYNRFSDSYLVCLKAIDHLNLKLRIISGHTASFKIGVSKVQDFGKFGPSPMYYTHASEPLLLVNAISTKVL